MKSLFVKLGDQVKKLATTAIRAHRNEDAGPALEEAFLLVFIGLVVSKSANQLGAIIQTGYTNATNDIKTALTT